jgi:hypothetical protein
VERLESQDMQWQVFIDDVAYRRFLTDLLTRETGTYLGVRMPTLAVNH